MAVLPIVADAPARPLGDVAERVARYLRPGALTLAALPPLSLYVHLPWCLKKCPYCDFNSHALARRRRAAASRATSMRWCATWKRRCRSSGAGACTPSSSAAARRACSRRAAIERLLAAIRARLPLEPGCEITLEANPGTFERERFRAYADAGVTRLSVGVQSFDDAKLAALGRVHDAAQARAAIAEAKAAFATFNIDLMYALPGQTLGACAADVAAALAFEPPHLSIYHLTIEPNTLFAHAPPPLPDDDLAAAMLDRIVASARPRASSATRSRRSRDRVTARATTSTTGSSATTSASAPARTARSASRIGSCARCGCAIPLPTWRARKATPRSHPRTRSRAPSCRSSSCSTRCA